jgi:hypothetical protein
MPSSVPVPVKLSDDPVPITIAAVMLVPDVSAEKLVGLAMPVVCVLWAWIKGSVVDSVTAPDTGKV